MYPKVMTLSVKPTLIVFFLMISFIMSSSALAETRESQVQIEAKLAEVNDSHARELGTDWNRASEIAHTRSLEHLGKIENLVKSQNVFDFKPLEFNPPQPVPNEIATEPRAEVQRTKSFKPLDSNFPQPVPNEILTEPHSQVQNTEPAKISTSVNLDATPQVQTDGTIKLAVVPQPQTIATTQTPDGSTEISRGLVEEKSKQGNKVPLLGHIPVLGHFFRQNHKAEKKDLLVFVTPSTVQPSSE